MESKKKFLMTFKDSEALFENKLTKEQIEFAKKYIEFSEYICIEFDPEKETATVKLVK